VVDDIDEGRVVDFGTQAPDGDMGPAIIWSFLKQGVEPYRHVGRQDPDVVDCCFQRTNSVGSVWKRLMLRLIIRMDRISHPRIWQPLMWYAYGEDIPRRGVTTDW